MPLDLKAMEDYYRFADAEVLALIEVARAADAKYNEHDDSICKHGNVTWNCEYCDGEKDERIEAALAALKGEDTTHLKGNKNA